MKKNCKKKLNPIDIFYKYFYAVQCLVSIFMSYSIWYVIIVFTWYATEYPIFHKETLFWLFNMFYICLCLLLAAGLSRLLMPF